MRGYERLGFLFWAKPVRTSERQNKNTKTQNNTKRPSNALDSLADVNLAVAVYHNGVGQCAHEVARKRLKRTFFDDDDDDDSDQI